MNQMNLEQIEKIIAKNVTITDQNLYESVFNAVLEAVDSEREACAQLCDARVGIWIIPAGPKECADAIRARSKL